VVEREGRAGAARRGAAGLTMQGVLRQFEVVVFTASLDKYANPVLDLMERNAPRSVHFRLFREHCVLTNGALVKDITVRLSCCASPAAPLLLRLPAAPACCACPAASRAALLLPRRLAASPPHRLTASPPCALLSACAPVDKAGGGSVEQGGRGRGSQAACRRRRRVLLNTC